MPYWTHTVAVLITGRTLQLGWHSSKWPCKGKNVKAELRGREYSQFNAESIYIIHHVPPVVNSQEL